MGGQYRGSILLRIIIIMANYLRNSRKSWNNSDEKKLKEYAHGNTPTRVAGFKLGRSEDAIRAKAHELGISLKPPNQSPYNRSKK
jgi:transposase